MVKKKKNRLYKRHFIREEKTWRETFTLPVMEHSGLKLYIKRCVHCWNTRVHTQTVKYDSQVCYSAEICVTLSQRGRSAGLVDRDTNTQPATMTAITPHPLTSTGECVCKCVSVRRGKWGMGHAFRLVSVISCMREEGDEKNILLHDCLYLPPTVCVRACACVCTRVCVRVWFRMPVEALSHHSSCLI